MKTRLDETNSVSHLSGPGVTELNCEEPLLDVGDSFLNREPLKGTSEEPVIVQMSLCQSHQLNLNLEND